MEKIIDWLLTAKPWVRYRTRLDLLDQDPGREEVKNDRKEMLSHPKIKALLTGLKEWPGEKLKRHNDANHLLHKLAFIADIGLKRADKEIAAICEKIFATQSGEGPFRVIVNIPIRFGGSGEDQLTWMLCDTPLIVYSLVKFGFAEDPRVKKAVDYLAGLVQDNGWRCTASPDLGRFRGPGRKDDPCPYANLLMLKLLAELPGYRDSDAAAAGLDSLFTLWERRNERKPYLFGMGTDFRKLKAPFVWYDILHVLDILTRYPGLRDHKCVTELKAILKCKKDENGYFKAESIYRAWRDWDFGQKKVPSPWLTLLAYRCLH
ncbi:MAG: hypothetical protein KAT34_12355 [Candidatus Aminicenantes bacterium]|nr:hypothetical protein [Candidatus Aminicenantes bacterium]